MDNEELTRLARALMEEADEMRPEWDWLAMRILPRARDVLRQLQTPPAEFRRSHCAKACEALHTLVSAFMSHVTPSGMRWFEFQSRASGESEKHRLWYRNATDVTLDALASSNFYTVLQEMHTDRCLFGTGCLLCESRPEGGLAFKHVPVGRYGIAEDKDGNVDTVCRSFEYTAHQAVQAWGIDKLPDEVRRAWEDVRARFTQKFEFLHLVTPRKTYATGNGNPDVNPKRMRYASVYLYNSGSMPVVEEGGYPEMPYLVSRFLKWESVWGYPPGRKCRDELEASVRAERNLDALGELAVYPRLFMDAEQEGDIDFRAGGMTVIDRNAAGLNLPREWGSSGRYDVGIERIERAEKKIESAFFVPFLQVVSSVDRGMTATEVLARQREQVLGISATFAQFVYDFNGMLARVFACLFRQGAFNTIKASQPKELLVPSSDGLDFSVEVPGVAYKGMISQSIEASQKQSLDYAMQTAAQYIQLTGDMAALDCVDMSRAVQFIFQSLGAPSEVYRSDAEIEELKQERAAAAEQQAALAAAQQMNLGSQAARNMAQV